MPIPRASGENEMPTMPPEKDPTFWVMFAAALRDHGLPAALAAVLTYLRVLYDDKEPRWDRRLIEAALGAVLVFLVGVGAEKFGMGGGLSYAVAGFVGVLGVEQVRQVGRRWAERKADSV
ncbi:phage holin family protein [Pseudomonas helleri]|uniref:phage holin family protein n=1 Tax=Pseudomonas helleri TaxID=1608996 RepID=UPI001E3A3737|nr:phage holin family protein [Pseudomonas helleri]